VVVRKAGGWVLRNNWSEVFLIGAEKMYTAAQWYRAEATTTKKKARNARGQIEGEAARGWASALEEGEEKEKERKGGEEREREREKERESARKISLPFNCKRI